MCVCTAETHETTKKQVLLEQLYKVEGESVKEVVWGTVSAEIYEDEVYALEPGDISLNMSPDGNLH